MPPINELTRIEPAHIERLDHQGIFTTGLLLEVSETPTRRETLATQVAADTTDVVMWRDEALMLNLASFGPADHQLMIQARIEGLRDILDLDLDDFRVRVNRSAGELGLDPPSDLTLLGWWEQARTLEDDANPAAVEAHIVSPQSDAFASGRRWAASLIAGVAAAVIGFVGVVRILQSLGPSLNLIPGLTISQVVAFLLAALAGSLIAGQILRVRSIEQWAVIGGLIFVLAAFTILALQNISTQLS